MSNSTVVVQKNTKTEPDKGQTTTKAANVSGKETVLLAEIYRKFILEFPQTSVKVQKTY